ncbi:polysaccharide biosynthesis/export family protein [Flavobacterium sp.]|uniref:polysaccharide biosynthesis/export family protein n=1 Tax=Flavobacterium sp. TaxID=239 RepID=UPI0025C15CCD|nr:polysaccharide biosynthesis/export family protein [Flavobacterium sp.]
MQLLNYEPTLKPDDMLSIIISSETPDATIPFNLPAIQGNYEVGNNQNGIKTYLIDNFGNIDFPVLGKLKLGGLTRTEASNKIVTAMSEYIKDPSVNLRILNYKISVLGEVNKPGTVPIESERITILEALSAAGDLTIYGKRDNILVIRETDGKKTYARIDLTKSDFTTSPYYYLTQNDVIVVEPNQTRMNSSVVGPNLTVIISGLSLLTAIMVIIFR